MPRIEARNRDFILYGQTFQSGSPNSALSSHLNFLESFDPRLNVNPFNWIPAGIYYDLLDFVNEDLPVRDRVSNFTNQQLFNALESDVRSMAEYRMRLILQNPNNQTQEIGSLFTEYRY